MTAETLAQSPCLLPEEDECYVLAGIRSWSTTPCTLNVRKLFIGLDDNTVNEDFQSFFPCLQENNVFVKRFLLCIMNSSKLGGHTDKADILLDLYH